MAQRRMETRHALPKNPGGSVRFDELLFGPLSGLGDLEESFLPYVRRDVHSYPFGQSAKVEAGEYNFLILLHLSLRTFNNNNG